MDMLTFLYAVLHMFFTIFLRENGGGQYIGFGRVLC